MVIEIKNTTKELRDFSLFGYVRNINYNSDGVISDKILKAEIRTNVCIHIENLEGEKNETPKIEMVVSNNKSQRLTFPIEMIKKNQITGSSRLK